MLRPPLLALALAAVLAVCCAPLARADGTAPAGAGVTIAPSDGGAARPLALADLADRFDVHGGIYTLRAADGATSSVTVPDGISLTALLAAAGLDADPYTYVEIPRPDGTSTLLLADDLGGTDEGPPVVWADDAGVHFLRPSEGEQDVNGGDLLTLPGGALALQLRTGEPLKPRIAASALRARPGQRIDFGASLATGTLGPGMDYQWYFDGSGTVLGANASHRFPRPGTYLVLLNVVRGGGEAIGLPDTVHVRIVRPRRDAPDDARRSGEAQGGDGVGAGGGPGGSGDGVGSGAGGDAPADGAAPSTGAAPSFEPAPPSSPAPVPSAVVPPSPAGRSPRPSRDTPARPRGDLVSGTLLASASAAVAPASGGPVARTAIHGAAADGPLDIPVGAWVAFGLALLLAVGWALESRHTLPFWQP